MLEKLFKGIFDGEQQQVIGVGTFLLLVGISIVLGLVLALIYVCKNKTTKSFTMTLSMLPALVCVVIMMVNGNIGAGVAVAGAFSLIRFRSTPGTAKEIASIFLAMAIGLIMGMGYIGFAVLFTIILGLFMFCLNFIGLKTKGYCKEKTLKITIPEDLNYTEVFDSILTKYTKMYELIHIKTTNLGSLFKLTYNVTIKDEKSEKAMIDELRLRNGNLEIALMRQENKNYDL